MLWSKEKARNHRRAKRLQEMALMSSMVRDAGLGPQAKILEFGCGSAHQTQTLTTLGQVTTSDLLESPPLDLPQGVPYVSTGIHQTPFKDGQFDLLFSNHVLEHVEDLEGAMEEMKRITKKGGLLLFSMPTPWWLLLSIPNHYRDSVANALRRFRNQDQPTNAASNKKEGSASGDSQRSSLLKAVGEAILPRPHGTGSSFFEELWSFSSRRWRSHFEKGGLELIQEKPLLIYGPSEMPVVPTRPAALGISSSTAYLLRN